MSAPPLAWPIRRSLFPGGLVHENQAEKRRETAPMSAVREVAQTR